MQLKDIERNLQRLGQDLVRLNGLISKNQDAAAALQDSTFHLERDVVCELRELEQKAAKLEADIDAAAEAKKGTLGDVLDTEKQIMLWERKIQLEKEMQALLDPSAGQARALTT